MHLDGSAVSVVMTLPVEVVLARDGSDAGLRTAFRERQGARATPVLAVHDAADAGLVRALGPGRESDTVRTLPADRLASLLRATVGQPRLAAIRQLTEELARLDDAGTPGLVVKGLLTRHLLTSRLPASADWTWLSMAAARVTPDADWRTALNGLGYALTRRQHRGWLARHDGAPVAVIHPVADAAALTRLDHDGRPPAGVLALDCAAEGVDVGILAAGTRIRLHRFGGAAGTPAATTSFLELDTAALDDSLRPLLGLLSPESLRPGGHLVDLLDQAQRFGTKLRERLDVDLREHVLPALARGLGSSARSEGRDLDDPKVREEIEHGCLTWVFRTLFVLYAESAGYLPLDQAGYAANAATTLATEAAAADGDLDGRASSLWDRMTVLVRALRTGDTRMRVPAYNGDLFAPDVLPGAALLERAVLTNDAVGPALAVLGRDAETGGGVDYSALDVSHLGHIYEGLLSLRLSVADADLGLYRTGSGTRRTERYERLRTGDEAAVAAGTLFWQTNTGGRKAGGVYYTPADLVDHLVVRAVLPTLEEHLSRVRALAERDPEAAAELLWRFRVLDPACGSAHFLVATLHRIAERIDRFLAETPLPAVRDQLETLRASTTVGVGSRVEHGDLLHRLVLKHCVFGVDISVLGAEVARLSLWLASFVPGLSLAYLGHNVQVGDALVGVADSTVVAGGEGQATMWDDQLEAAIHEAGAAATELASIGDRNPEEVTASRDADERVRAATVAVRRLFDAWTAGPLGVAGARRAIAQNPDSVLRGTAKDTAETAELVTRMRPKHWPLDFPEVFASPNNGTSRGGFDVVVGNPPWEEVTVEELAFYAQYSPRLRGLPAGPRADAMGALKTSRPELAAQLESEQQRIALMKSFLSPAGGYELTAGDPDLYKFFCQRYRTLLRPGGRLGVVLPRSVFVAAGSRSFRAWLFGSSSVERIDFLLNNRHWMFDTHGQYTVALLVASATRPEADHRVDVAGVASSADEFDRQAASPGIALRRAAFGIGDVIPVLPSQSSEPVLATMQRSRPFPFGGGRWLCFPTRELHETDDKELWTGATAGWPLWKGESFGQHDPHGSAAQWCPPTPAAMKKANKPKPGSESMLAKTTPLAQRRNAVAAEVGHIRLAFRDATNRTNSRTVLASLVPAKTFLLNSALYLVFLSGGHRERVACAAIMNSLPFDWQARRFVESHVSYFILELLTVPDLDDETFAELVQLGGRLSCPDERFAEVAAACDVEVGPLDQGERMALRARVDALVARAYGLGVLDLEVMFTDFTLDAVPARHRAAVRAELEALTS